MTVRVSQLSVTKIKVSLEDELFRLLELLGHLKEEHGAFVRLCRKTEAVGVYCKVVSCKTAVHL